MFIILVTALSLNSFSPILARQSEAARSESKTLEAEPDEIKALINELNPTRTGNSRKGPSLQTQAQVESKLLELANESAEDRARVIHRLIEVVKDPVARDVWPVATAWMMCVDLLGELKATEAIEVLIENMDHTGQNGVIMSIHIRPVSKALRRIGEAAAPKLEQALADATPSVKIEAARALFDIQGRNAKRTLESAYEKEKDDEVKLVIKDVLDRIERGYLRNRDDN
jgi:HEAT repeat protein